MCNIVELIKTENMKKVDIGDNLAILLIWIVVFIFISVLVIFSK